MIGGQRTIKNVSLLFTIPLISYDFAKAKNTIERIESTFTLSES